ncbi:MAG: IPT/TIG domain-containing protein [Dehalococcoidales bacterium]|nr:IPT/TIG domain-containing protein [Dehalococcoidales bacterium]
MSGVLKCISITFVLVLLFCLGPAAPILADATITISDDEGIYGDNITVKGRGFTGDEEVTVYFDDEEMDSDTLDTGDSSFSISFEVPSIPAGDYDIEVTGDETGTFSESFAVHPCIILSNNKGSPGDSLTVYGYGFAKSESNIRVTFDGTAVGSTKTASSNGYWYNTITIPSMAGGDYTISAFGSKTDTSDLDELTYSLEVNSLITIDKTSGPPGTQITIHGSGFAANESGVRVTFNGNMVGTTPSVSSTGTWSMTFNVANMPGGSYSVDASGNTTTADNISDLTFRVEPTFTISPTTGSEGTLVTASGTAFGASETINLTYDNAPIGTPVTADSTGSWTSTFSIPISSSGPHKIGAGSNIAPLNFTIGSSISINKTSGISGTSVTVSGSGFGANESGISVTFDGSPIGPTVQASATGAWNTNITIPQTTGGEHSIGASGKSTAATAIAESFFTVLPVLSPLNKTSGPEGTSVTLSGTSFAANENINITFDGTAVDQKIRADESGSWTATFKIPPAPSGNHTIKVNGTSTSGVNLDELTFKMTSGITIDPPNGSVDTTVNVSGSGFTAGSPLKITYDDDPINKLGTVTVNDTGDFLFSFKIPTSKAGLHIIKVIDNQNIMETTEFFIDDTPPTVPKPVSPIDGETMGFTGNINPTLAWSKSTGSTDVTYTLQISNEPDFIYPLIEKTDISATRYTLNRNETLEFGEYYWRVKAVDSALNESEWSRFYMIKSGVISTGMLALYIVLGVLVLTAALVFLVIRPLLKKRKTRRARAEAEPSEIIVPEVVNAEYRTIESEEPNKRKAIGGWRLALPQAPGSAAKGTKTLSSEDQARLKVIIEFARSIPLVEPGYNTGWLVEMAESVTGSAASPILCDQVLKGEIQVRYEPAWMRHPTFLDLQTLLEGQPIIQDLNAYIDSVNQAAADAVTLLQEIYKETTAEISWDALADGGWEYISGVYIDAITWYQGKNLREPSEKDYTIQPQDNPAEGNILFALNAEQSTSFSGILSRTNEEGDAARLRVLHIKLRRTFRNNDRASDLVHVLTQLEVQRGRLTNAFSSFSKLNP